MKSKFVRVSCPRCNKTQIIFGKASTQVKCKFCKALLVRPTGGKAKIRAAVREVLP